MNKMIMGVSALLWLIAAPALAADLAARTYTKAPVAPVVDVYDWTGGYVGIEGGYGWGHSDQTDPGIAPHTGLRLADPAHDLIGANTVRAQKDDLSPPDMLVRGVAVPR